MNTSGGGFKTLMLSFKSLQKYGGDLFHSAFG
jgi:hypothetical protein